MDNQDNNHKEKPTVFVSGSAIEAKKSRKHLHFLTAGTALLLILIGTGFYLSSDAIITLGNEFLAANDVGDDVLAEEEEGYAFAFGTEPSDDRDFSTFSLPEPDQALEDRFYEALNTSPAFDEIDSVNELLEYDQVDKNGNISEQAMRDIIAIAEGTEE